MIFMYLREDILVVWDQWRFRLMVSILFRLRFFACRRRGLRFLLPSSGIKDIIVKFSKRFS